MSGSELHHAEPFISVVIATRKRRDRLKLCLESLAALHYPPARWEAIVVEDGDQEPLGDGLLALCRRLPLRWFRVEHAGCGLAKNAGASQARGRYVIFTDDDCRFPQEWLLCYERAFTASPECLIAGRATNPLRANRYSDASQELVNYAVARWNDPRGEAGVAIGNNFGLAATTFRDLGGFSPSYFPMAAEDRDFAARWVGTGRRIRYAPEIVVEHGQQLTFRSLLRQQYFYGRGASIFHRLQAERRRGRVRFEAGNFYLSLLKWPWTVRAGREAAGMTMLFLCAQAAHTAGYVRGRLQRPPRDGGRMEKTLASMTEVDLGR